VPAECGLALCLVLTRVSLAPGTSLLLISTSCGLEPETVVSRLRRSILSLIKRFGLFGAIETQPWNRFSQKFYEELRCLTVGAYSDMMGCDVARIALASATMDSLT
jgi:hypothetical protein